MIDGTQERPDMHSHAGAWERVTPGFKPGFRMAATPAEPNGSGVLLGRRKQAGKSPEKNFVANRGINPPVPPDRIKFSNDQRIK